MPSSPQPPPPPSSSGVGGGGGRRRRRSSARRSPPHGRHGGGGNSLSPPLPRRSPPRPAATTRALIELRAAAAARLDMSDPSFLMDLPESLLDVDGGGDGPRGSFLAPLPSGSGLGTSRGGVAAGGAGAAAAGWDGGGGGSGAGERNGGGGGGGAGDVMGRGQAMLARASSFRSSRRLRADGGVGGGVGGGGGGGGLDLSPTEPLPSDNLPGGRGWTVPARGRRFTPPQPPNLEDDYDGDGKNYGPGGAVDAGGGGGGGADGPSVAGPPPTLPPPPPPPRIRRSAELSPSAPSSRRPSRSSVRLPQRSLSSEDLLSRWTSDAAGRRAAGMVEMAAEVAAAAQAQAQAQAAEGTAEGGEAAMMEEEDGPAAVVAAAAARLGGYGRAGTGNGGRAVDAASIELARRFLWDDDEEAYDPLDRWRHQSRIRGTDPEFSSLRSITRSMDWGSDVNGGARRYPWAWESRLRDGMASDPAALVENSSFSRWREASASSLSSSAGSARFSYNDADPSRRSGGGILRSLGRAFGIGVEGTKLRRGGGSLSPRGREAGEGPNLAPRRESIGMRPEDRRRMSSPAFAQPRSRCGGCCSGADSWSAFDRRGRKVLLIAVSLTALALGTFAVHAGRGRAPPSPRGGAEADGLAPGGSERAAAIRWAILESNVTSAGDIDLAGSPQYMALTWLAEEDGAALDPDDDMLLQRYALAVFYYSAWPSVRALGNVFGAEAEDSLEDADGSLVDVFAREKGWMTDSGYCSWVGVGCHNRTGSREGEISNDGNYGVTELNLTKSDVHGSLPSELAALTDLRVFDLIDNGVIGTIPTQLGGLRQLVSLGLSNNRFNSTIPTEFGMLEECTLLLLDRNKLDGSIPSHIGNMVSLRVLSLRENFLSGTFPSVERMAGLRSLYLDNNELSGTLPGDVVANLTQLEDLWLSHNNFTGPIPSQLGKIERLSVAHLEYNSLSSTIPWQLYRLKELDELHLHQNNLSGEIPKQLGELRDLEILNLDGNGFTGQIPATIGDCDDLAILHLQSNQLTGTIPAQIIRLVDLVSLRIDNNQIGGPFPRGFARLFRLETISLNENEMTGQITEDMSRFKYLKKVQLQGNNFTGAVPEGICALRENTTGGGKLEILQADCGGEDPRVVCTCCTECFE